MNVDDREIRSLVLSRADRADSRGLRLAVVEAVRKTPQIHPLVRVPSRARRAWPLRFAAGVVALAVMSVAIGALSIGLRPPGGPRLNSGEASPASTPEATATPPASDVPLTPPPYGPGSCPVTPITDLAGGVAPEVVSGNIRWHLDGTGPWATGVGHKVGLFATSSYEGVGVSTVVAERLPIGSIQTPLSVRYPRGDGPGFIFGIGLPEPGCWVLTAVGAAVHSSVVVEVGPGPANPPSATSQNVPTVRAPLVPLAQCPTSPEVPGAAIRTWLDGNSQWQDPDPKEWTAGMQRKLVVSGILRSFAPYELVVATRVGIVGTGDSQRSAFVADTPVFTTPTPGNGSKALELRLPTAGCWAITYLDPTATSTIVVELTR